MKPWESPNTDIFTEKQYRRRALPQAELFFIANPEIIKYNQIMKKIILISVLIIFLCSMNLSAEAPFSEPSQNTEVNYRLFPTQNMWTFLKLDTVTGQIWQVQYSVKEEDGYRFECVLSNIDIAELYYKPKKIGRYTLFPTKNMYNFIMLDQIDGDVFQVQWSTEPENRFVLPIKSVIQSYLESLHNPTESEAESQ